MVQEIIGLGFQRVRADRDDGVGEFGVFVAVVEFAHAHVARGVHLGIVGRSIVDADVLHLHGTEIELAGAPGVLIAAAGTAVIVGRDEQPILAHFVDHADGDARNQIERIVPACRLHLPVAPHHRVRQALQLGIARARVAHFRHPGAAHRPEAGIHDAVMVGLDDDVHVFAVLLDDVVHRRRIPGDGFCRLLFAEIDSELVLVGRGAALLVGRPRVGLVAAADDAIVADDVEFLRVLRDDRKAVDVTFESHWLPPSQNVGQPAVQKLVDALGVDVAVAVDAQHVLREVLRCVAPGLLAASLDIETRVVTWTIQRPITLVVRKRKSLVRTRRGEANDVAVRASAGRNALAELDENPGASASG